jgi:hypothetical protein
MKTLGYRSAACAILIVAALLSLIPGIIPEARVNGTLEFAHPWMWTAIVGLFALAPYVLVLAMASPRRAKAHQPLARGLAVGTALAAIGALGLSLAVALYVLLFGTETLLTVQIGSCVLLIAMNAWMLWSAVRKDALSHGLFYGGVLAALMLASLEIRGVRRIEAAAAARVRTYHRNMYAADRSAIQALRQLAVCASTYRMSHEGHLPTDLPALVSATGCDPALAAPSAVPEYAITLTVDPADTVTPSATMGCTFTATFTGTLLGARASQLDGRTLWSTCAGLVYVRELGQPEGTRARLGEGFPLDVGVLFRNIFLSASESGGRYPATLGALLASPHLRDRRYLYDASVLGAQQRADLDRNLFRTGQYVVRYVSGPEGFRIEASCERYGPTCMRGYLIDDSGVVRGTGEPRPARATDPLTEQCEFTGQWCDGRPGSLEKPRPQVQTVPDVSNEH